MTHRHLPTLLIVLLLLLIPSTAFAIGESDRPDLLEPAEGCELWLGEAMGNDPSVRIHMRLCPNDSGADRLPVKGELQWSSLNSGWNLRAVEGHWARGADGERTLEMRDVDIIDERPEPGWRFCTVDRYTLTLRPGEPRKLTGTYRSAACDDSASMSVTFQSNVTDPNPSAPLPDLPPPRTPTPESSNCGACGGCQAAPGAAGGAGGLGAILILLIALAGIRPRWGRSTPGQGL